MRFLWPMGARKSRTGKMGLDFACGKGGVGWTGGREGECRQERLPGLRTVWSLCGKRCGCQGLL